MTQVIHRWHRQEYYFRGRLYFKNEAYAEAVADFTEAIRHEPQSGRLYFDRGRARYYQGDKAGAAEDFRQVLQLLREDHPEAELARQFLEEISLDSTDESTEIE
jgi:tetratricopeptide (TPR) repeat protein